MVCSIFLLLHGAYLYRRQKRCGAGVLLFSGHENLGSHASMRLCFERILTDDNLVRGTLLLANKGCLFKSKKNKPVISRSTMVSVILFFRSRLSVMF